MIYSTGSTPIQTQEDLYHGVTTFVQTLPHNFQLVMFIIDHLQSTLSWLISKHMAIRKHLFLISDPTEPQVLELTSTIR